MHTYLTAAGLKATLDITVFSCLQPVEKDNSLFSIIYLMVVLKYYLLIFLTIIIVK